MSYIFRQFNQFIYASTLFVVTVAGLSFYQHGMMMKQANKSAKVLKISKVAKEKNLNKATF